MSSDPSGAGGESLASARPAASLALAAGLSLGGYYVRPIRTVALGGKWLVVWQRNFSHDDSLAETLGTFIHADGNVYPCCVAEGDQLLLGNIANASFEDVKSVAVPVLQHRIILEYNARIDGKTNRQVVEDLWEEYAEQLRSLGAGPWRAIPTLLWDGRFRLLTAIMAGFGRAIAEVGAVIIVGGNIQHATRVMTTTIALETSKGNLALALGLGLILVTLALGVNATALVISDAARQRYG